MATLLRVVVLAALLLGGAVAVPASAAPEPGAITTLAGGSHGDGLPAPRAPLAFPRGVAVGPDGLVYIADFFHHRVRRVAADGRIEAFAGFVTGNGGDGGDALRASLNRPMGLDFDAAGNLYIADGGNHRVRKITPDRVISTVAGNGVRGFGGDGGDGKQARLSFPNDVAVDSAGNVYVADTENNRVRRIEAHSGTISTYAGGGLLLYSDGAQADSVPLGGVYGLAVDAADNLYIGSYCAVYKVEPSNRTIRRIIGPTCGYGGDGGPAAGARLGGIVTGLNVSDDGRLWIADTQNHVVRVVEADGTIATAVGSGSTDGVVEDGMAATDAPLHWVRDTAMDAHGNLYVVEEKILGHSGHERVYRVHADGSMVVYAGSATRRAVVDDGDPATTATFGRIEGLAWDDAGRLYVADAAGGGGYIWRIDPDGRIYRVAGNGEADPDDAPDVDGPAREVAIEHPLAIDFAPDGRLYIVDAGPRQIKVYDPATGRLSVAAGMKAEVLHATQEEVMPAGEASLYFPKGLAVHPDGDVYWSEGSYSGGGVSRIRRLHDGMVRFVAGGLTGARFAGYGGDGGNVREAKFGDVRGLEFDSAGNLYVADTSNARVRRVDATTKIVDTVAGDGANENRVGTIGPLASFAYTRDVEVGPDGVFVADPGHAYVTADSTGPFVDHVAANGMVSHVAGTGTIDLTFDGPALATPLLQPRAVALGSGGLAVADYHRVRLVTAPAGGWPVPVRDVVCLPNHTDTSGDARTRVVLGFHSANNPSLDVRGSEVRTDGGQLVVTTRVQDLDPVAVAVNYDPHHQAKGWVYLFYVNGKWRYLAAFVPFNLGDPGGGASNGGWTFEHGTFEIASGYGDQGTAEVYNLQRLGPAAGNYDYTTETVMVQAPVQAVGARQGDVIIYQNALAGSLLQLPLGVMTYKGFGVADAVPWQQAFRSITVGTTCPGSFS